MDKLQFKRLLSKYRKELSNGDKTHLKDVIAMMVILDICSGAPFPFDMEVRSIIARNITLSDLFNPSKWESKDYYIDEYKAPKIERLKQIKKEITRDQLNTLLPRDLYLPANDQKAAVTWLEMMIQYGLIKEKQQINPLEYLLGDFISDDLLDKTKK